MFDKCTVEGAYTGAQPKTVVINRQREEAVRQLGPEVELLSTETKQMTTQDGTLIDRLLTVWGVRKETADGQPG